MTRISALFVSRQTNQSTPWLMFEAGALAKKVDKGTRVIPLLLDMSPSNLLGHPLTQIFQAKAADKDGLRDVAVSVNQTLDTPLSDEKLARRFEKYWDDFAT